VATIHAQPKATAQTDPAPRIDGDAIILVSGDKAWSIQQLNRKAFALLRAKRYLPENGATTAIVHIPTDHTNLLCQIRYSQGLGSHQFRAEIGRNGELVNIVDEGTVNEGIGKTQQEFYDKYLKSLETPPTNVTKQK
jgi:hypothetical protein